MSKLSNFSSFHAEKEGLAKSNSFRNFQQMKVSKQSFCFSVTKQYKSYKLSIGMRNLGWKGLDNCHICTNTGISEKIKIFPWKST